MTAPRTAAAKRLLATIEQDEPVNLQKDALTAWLHAIEAEAAALRAALPAHLRGDGPCQDCGTLDNPVWFTDNVLWNHVTGETVVAEDPRQAILCPNCFLIRADRAGLHPTGWRLLPEWPWREYAAPLRAALARIEVLAAQHHNLPIYAEAKDALRPRRDALAQPAEEPHERCGIQPGSRL